MALTLSSPVTDLPRIGPAKATYLAKLGITHARDFLYTFPSRYDDFSKITPIAQLKAGEKMTVRGRVKSVKNSWGFRGRQRLLRIFCDIEDETGTLSVTWYNLRFLSKQLWQGRELAVAGTVELNQSRKGGGSQDLPPTPHPLHPQFRMRSPVIEFTDQAGAGTHTGRITPVYPETYGVTSRFLRYNVKTALPLLQLLPEYLPDDIRQRNELLGIREAIETVHFPDDSDQLEMAQRRLRFDELFFLQLAALVRRRERQQHTANPLVSSKQFLQQFEQALPFALTEAQKVAIDEIAADMAKAVPMNRLLQGDVGSGKSVVALYATQVTLSAGYKVLYLAPTGILAQQQATSFRESLGEGKVALLVGSLTSREKQAIKQRLQTEESLCVVGTHALLQEDVVVKNLALTVVDEQHRFGVKQRQALLRRSTQTIRRYTQKETPINAEGGDHFLYRDLSYQIRGALFDVRKEIGLGLKENVYHKALEEALRNRNLHFEREKLIDVTFNGKKVGSFRPDLVVEDKIILELKALPFIGKTEEKQLWTYLKGSSYRLGLLINFGSQELKIKRVVYDTARNRRSQRKSASSLRQSAQQMTPHLLSMTATPIPRTLNLTVYGDLDVSILNELPPGRQPIKTQVVAPEKRDGAIIHILEELHAGRQGYVIAPLVDQSEKLEAKSATETFEEMRQLFPGIAIGLLHGKLPAEEKTAVLNNFAAGALQLLVSTSVVEVGVNVPNATVMIIEGAERFGLAQLHQFRGRVGRGDAQSYCYLFPTTAEAATSARLRVLGSTNDGFKIAEEDLQLRGPGEVYGAAQSGFGDLQVASLLDYELIKLTRTEAARLLERDPELAKHPILQGKVKQKNLLTHFE